MDLLRLYYTTHLGDMVDEGLFDAYIAEAEIAERVAKKFNVTVEYVKELMMPKAV